MNGSSWMRVGLVLSVGLLVGCGGAQQLVNVKGTVTVNGEPAAGVQLVLVPTVTDGGAPASGVTNENGSFTLSTGMEKGARPGQYRVGATWPAPPEKEPTEQEKMMGLVEQGPDRLKGKYTPAKDSPITIDVVSGQEDLSVIELEAPAS